MSGPESEGVTSREAFDLVGNETRAEILRVLSEERGGELPPSLTFSDLRERVAPDTRSSQFSYHLDRLVGTFVEDRSEGSAQPRDEFVTESVGYALRPSGTFLTRLVTAMGVPDDAPAEVEPFGTDVSCHFCGTDVEASYRNWTFELTCPGCGHLYIYTLTPPGLVADDPDKAELLDRAAAYLRRKYTTFARGSCPLCANGVDPEFVSPADINWPGADRLSTLVRRHCGHCGNLNYALLGTELLRDSRLVAFCRTHGRDVTETPIWELPFAITDEHTDVVSEEPWAATVTVPAGDARLRLRVDSDVTVREYAEV